MCGIEYGTSIANSSASSLVGNIASLAAEDDEIGSVKVRVGRGRGRGGGGSSHRRGGDNRLTKSGGVGRDSGVGGRRDIATGQQCQGEIAAHRGDSSGVPPFTRNDLLAKRIPGTLAHGMCKALGQISKPYLATFP